MEGPLLAVRHRDHGRRHVHGWTLIQRLWIPCRLPGQNEMLKAAKSGRGKSNAYSRQKASFTVAIVRLVAEQKIAPVARARFAFVWHEPNKRRDPDNVTAGQKFVFDGLVAAGTLPGDGWGHVLAIYHEWVASADSGVEVFITEGEHV